MKNNLILLFVMLWSLSFHAQHKDYVPDSSAVIRQRLEEWQDLKFGLLMHWGPYSQWGIVESWSICPEDLSWAAGGRKQGVADSYNEYVKAYENLQTTFNPTQFDPEKWAKAAGDAGMKYMVFTTKHHDGFCMFDTQLTDYKITGDATPFHMHPKSDVTQEIFRSFRKEGFWIGAYYSKPDWHSNDYWWDNFPATDRNCNYSIQKYPQRWKSFVDYTHGQINELITRYGDIDILWLDGGWVRPKDSLDIAKTLFEQYEGSRWARNPQSEDIDMPRLVHDARSKQSDLIVVDRAVPGPYQNYLTPEQHIPDNGLPYPWETCMTMATSWSYAPKDIYKPTDVLITNLVDIVSKGGNFLLNIGPSPEGTFDTAAYQRLSDIGRWMKQNGRAIYNTRMFDVFGESNGIRYTRTKDKKSTFVFIPDNTSSTIDLSHLPYSKKLRAHQIGTDTKVKIENNNGSVRLIVPEKVWKAGEWMWVVEVILE